MERKIITFGNHFRSFIESVDDSVRRKIDYVLDMLKTLKRINSKFVKLIKDGVYELRVEWEGNIYRVFFIFDDGNIVVLFNGFQKKTDFKRQRYKTLRIQFCKFVSYQYS